MFVYFFVVIVAIRTSAEGLRVFAVRATAVWTAVTIYNRHKIRLLSANKYVLLRQHKSHMQNDNQRGQIILLR